MAYDYPKKANLLAFATKVSLESKTYTGIGYNDPEYKIIANIMDDDIPESLPLFETTFGDMFRLVGHYQGLEASVLQVSVNRESFREGLDYCGIPVETLHQRGFQAHRKDAVIRSHGEHVVDALFGRFSEVEDLRFPELGLARKNNESNRDCGCCPCQYFDFSSQLLSCSYGSRRRHSAAGCSI